MAGWWSQAVEQAAHAMGMFAHEGPETWCIVGTSTLGAAYVSGPYADRDEAAQATRKHGGAVLLMHPPRLQEDDDDE